MYDSKEEEIAKLEEQLKKLKEETQEESKEVMIAEVDEESKLEEAEEVVPEEMFLTERWKEEWRANRSPHCVPRFERGRG